MNSPVELIFYAFLFVALWYLLFKLKLRVDNKRMINGAVGKIMKQDKMFVLGGEKYDLKERLGLALKERSEKRDKRISELEQSLNTPIAKPKSPRLIELEHFREATLKGHGEGLSMRDKLLEQENMEEKAILQKPQTTKKHIKRKNKKQNRRK